MCLPKLFLNLTATPFVLLCLTAQAHSFAPTGSTDDATATTIAMTPSTVSATGYTYITGSVTSLTAGLPTGTVTLYNATTGVSYGAVALSNGSVSGSFDVATIPLLPGNYSMYLKYSGDGTFAASESPSMTLTVISAGTGQVTLAPANASLTLTAGGSTTDLLTLIDANFQGTQNLTCSVAFSGTGTTGSMPGCAFNPAALTLTGSGTATSTLTVTTVASAGASSNSRRTLLTDLGEMTFGLLVLAALPRSRRRAVQAIRLFSALLFLATTLGILTACGASTAVATTPATIGTTRGTYIITVNANSAPGQATNVGYSGSINLTVQ